MPPENEDWKSALPDDLKVNESIKDFKDVGSLVKSYIETKGLVGRSIRPPGPDASEADRKAFRENLQKVAPELMEIPSDPTKFAEVEGQLFERLGRPKDAKEYPKVETPDGVQVDEEELRAVATKLGMTKKQFKTFADGVVAERVKVVGLQSDARKALKAELGPAFDDRLSAAAGAAQKLGAPVEMVKALQLGNVPVEQARLWIGVAKSIGHEGSEFNRDSSKGGRMTPAEAKSQINEILNNPALHERGNPKSKELAQKLVELHEIADP